MAKTVDRSRMLADIELPDRYEIRRRIANGGMASVWCAHDRTLGRNVAIKLLSERYAHDPSAVRRFKREARTAARLSSHRHVVTIYDVGEATPASGAGSPGVSRGDASGRAFLVMEYLPGGTVADARRVGAVNRREAVQWLHQAAAALDYAHGHGIVHRDIKLANFLLDCDRVLHVADFGIARIGTEDTLTGTGEMLGTAAYLAPERALGRPATEASDRYSLAVAAFELLAGQRPFTAEHFAGQARQHVEDEPPAASSINSALPPAVDAVLARGLSKRPEDRWPTATSFAEAIELAMSGGARRRRPGDVAAGGPAAGGLSAARGAAARGAAARERPAPRRTWEGDRAGARAGAAAYEPRRSSRRQRPIVPLVALAALALGVGIAVGNSDHGSSGSAKTTAQSGSTRGTTVAATAPAKKSATHRSTSTSTSSTTASSPSTSSTTASSPSTSSTTASSPSATASMPSTTNAAATTPPPTADTLAAQGHGAMESGDYQTAITDLRRAVAQTSPGSLTYAYALYDLGRSLRLGGDPQAAIPILYERLQIPNQTETVRQELQLALQAVGQKYRGSGGGAPAGPPGKPGHGGGHGKFGGDQSQGD